MLKSDGTNTIQGFAPTHFDSVSLTANTEHIVTLNENLRATMYQYGCTDDIQVKLNGFGYGLPKKENLIIIAKEIKTISFTSTTDTTLSLAWMI